MTEIFNFTTIEKKSLSYKKLHKRQNDRKAHFWENCKKVKIWVESHLDVVRGSPGGWIKISISNFKSCRYLPQEDSLKKLRRLLCKWGRYLTFWTLETKKTRNIEVFCIFLKNAPEYIDPSGHFVFDEILCSSNFLGQSSPRCCSRGSPGG